MKEHGIKLLLYLEFVGQIRFEFGAPCNKAKCRSLCVRGKHRSRRLARPLGRQGVLHEEEEYCLEIARHQSQWTSNKQTPDGIRKAV